MLLATGTPRSTNTQVNASTREAAISLGAMSVGIPASATGVSPRFARQDTRTPSRGDRDRGRQRAAHDALTRGVAVPSARRARRIALATRWPAFQFLVLWRALRAGIASPETGCGRFCGRGAACRRWRRGAGIARMGRRLECDGGFWLRAALLWWDRRRRAGLCPDLAAAGLAAASSAPLSRRRTAILNADSRKRPARQRRACPQTECP